jgi:serine/threonine-protein kinase
MKVSLGRCELASSVGPVPPAFDEWFARATEVDPGRRFQSANELTQALRRLAAEAQPPHPGESRQAPGELFATQVAAAASALPKTIGEPSELLHTEAAAITSNTNSAVTSPMVAAQRTALARRGQWSGGAAALALAVAAAVAGTLIIVVGGGTWFRTAPQQDAETSAPPAATVLEASQPLRAAESQAGARAASGLVGGLPNATLMALPAPTAALLVAPAEQVEQVAGPSGAPSTSEKGSRSRRAGSRGKSAATRARAPASDVSPAEGSVPSKRRSSRAQGVPPAAKATTVPNRLDAYDWQ